MEMIANVPNEHCDPCNVLIDWFAFAVWKPSYALFSLLFIKDEQIPGHNIILRHDKTSCPGLYELTPWTAHLTREELCMLKSELNCYGASTWVYIYTLLGDPEVTANIYCKSRNLPDTDTQNYSTDLR